MRSVFTDNVLPTKIRSFLNFGEGGVGKLTEAKSAKVVKKPYTMV